MWQFGLRLSFKFSHVDMGYVDGFFFTFYSCRKVRNQVFVLRLGEIWREDCYFFCFLV